MKKETTRYISKSIRARCELRSQRLGIGSKLRHLLESLLHLGLQRTPLLPTGGGVGLQSTCQSWVSKYAAADAARNTQ